MARRLFLALLLLVPSITIGQVDTRDGTAVTTATTLDGETGIDTADGQAVKSSGPTVDEDFADCDDMTDVLQSVTCSSGKALPGYLWGWNYGYHNTTLSTDEHYAEIDSRYDDGAPILQAGPMVRSDGNGTSSVGYIIKAANSGSDVNIILYKFSGVTTTYVTETNITSQSLTDGGVVKQRLSVNGSDQFSFWIDIDDDGIYQSDEKKDAFATDTSHTGGTYVGVFFGQGDGAACPCGDIEWLRGDDE